MCQYSWIPLHQVHHIFQCFKQSGMKSCMSLIETDINKVWGYLIFAKTSEHDSNWIKWCYFIYCTNKLVSLRCQFLDPWESLNFNYTNPEKCTTFKQKNWFQDCMCVYIFKTIHVYEAWYLTVKLEGFYKSTEANNSIQEL